MEIRIEEEVDLTGAGEDKRVMILVAEEEFWPIISEMVINETHPVDEIFLDREKRTVSITIAKKKVVGE